MVEAGPYSRLRNTYTKGDRRMRIVVTRNREPTLVVTAYWIAHEEV